MKNILQYILAISMIIVGIDKFLFFLPTCSLTEVASTTQLMVVGIIEIILGILLLLDKQAIIILIITILLMLFAIVTHLMIGTIDIAFAVMGLITTIIILFQKRKENLSFNKGGF